MAEEEDTQGEVEETDPGDDVAAPDFEARASLPFPVVGIGASAGGVQALESFFDNVAANSGMAYVVVQHLSPDHTSLLHEIIARRARIPVLQIEDGMAVQADHVYVIAPGFTLTLEGGRLKLGAPVEKRGHRRPVDDFFRSLAEEQNEKAIAVILSGTGTNGTAGAQAIKASGGICIAQQPESAAFPGMPRSLISAGYADQVLEPGDIPEILRRYSQHPYAAGDDSAHSAEAELQRDRAHLREILAILRTRTRHDFTGYRKATLLRRVQRRMGLTASSQLRDYAAVLRNDPIEAGALANDLMINVTGFFRDPEAWEALRVTVVAPLVAACAERGSIRCWVTACASGEEAYTLAMVLAEELGDRVDIDVKIFATDTAERSLALARAGIYPGGIEANMPPERLERFFDREEHIFRVKKEIREMVVFAPQDVLRDPPFSRIDITSCRNLLIYLEPETQQRVLTLLHFSLRSGGYLFLGNTESYSGSEHMFEVVNKRWRIFRRIGATPNRFSEMPSLVARSYEESLRVAEPATPRPSATMIIQRALLERYGPPTVVVDRTDRVAYFHGATGEFLESPAGEPTRDLLQLVRTPFRTPVRAALRNAMRDNTTVTVTVPVHSNGGQSVEILVAPLLATKNPEFFMVSFTLLGTAQVEGSTTSRDSPHRISPEAEEQRLLRLELANTTEAYEATNEELKAAHEEATSMNEELQSANEELETSKEELQSINEELTTVNNQLQSKITQLEATTNDLANLLSSTDIAVLFLDDRLRVRRFTPAVSDLLDLIESDIGRPITDLAQKFTDENLTADVRSVLQRLIPVEREMRSHSGRWYLRRTLPYRTTENHIEGVVITFIDIVARKQAELEIVHARDRVQAVLEQMPTAVVIAESPSGRLMYANKLATAMFGRAVPASPLWQLDRTFKPTLDGRRRDGNPYQAVDWPFARSLASDEVVTDEEIEIPGGERGNRVLSVSSSPIQDAEGKKVAVVGTFFDITQRKNAEQTLADAEQRFRLLVESARDFAIFTLNSFGKVLSWNSGAERILGWAEAEITGQSAERIFTPEDRAANVPEREITEALQTGRANDERWHLRKDGSRFWASGVMARMVSPNGTVFGLVKILRDTTESKLAEERLREVNALAERATAEAVEANRAKDEFISVVSHELRTPLNTIRLWARMLGNEKLSAKVRADGVQMVERAAVSQQQVIDDLFDVSRIDSGKLKLSLRDTRLADAIRAAVAAVEPVSGARGIRLTKDVDAGIGIVRADPGRIQQVVWNLLSNAVKFTPQGGEVTVSARRDAGNIVIVVRDSGAGIPPEFLPHVFERFRQAEAVSTRAHGGLGLGLAIAKQIVDLHAGEITADSAGRGKGATFTVRLPLANHGAAFDSSDADQRSADSDIEGLDILLVEDEATTRDVMCRLLESRRAKVRAVDTVAAARDAIDVRLPQLLISDIGLPGEDGFALIQHLRSLPGKQRIGALAVTAFVRPEDRHKVLNAGYDDHLAKPIDPQRLLELVAKLATR